MSPHFKNRIFTPCPQHQRYVDSPQANSVRRLQTEGSPVQQVGKQTGTRILQPVHGWQTSTAICIVSQHEQGELQ